MIQFFRGILKMFVFCCFLLSLAVFSGLATIRYIYATGTVEIPEVVDKDIVYAVDLLSDRHLRLKAVDYQFDTNIPKDYIIHQDPEPGTESKKNRTVRVVVSKGAESALIPNLLGKHWQEAEKLIRQHRFRLGKTAYVHSTEAPLDHIITQNPPPQTDAKAGTVIDLLVSRGAYTTVMVMPDLVEQQLQYAQKVIEDLGLVLGKVEREEYPDIPSDIVLSQIPKPGALVEEQNIVTLVASGVPGEPRSERSGLELPVYYETLDYTVPPGSFDREVIVMVRNAEGISEMYRQYVPPGNRIVINIPVVGDTVVELYLDGTLELIERF